MQVGGFCIHQPEKPDLLLSNTLVGEGALAFLQLLFKATATLSTNLYMGLTTATYSYATTLADVAAEEPVGNGYARAVLVRSGSGWDVSYVNTAYRAKSVPCAFVASDNWTKSWSNAFICTVASGAGSLIAISKKLSTPQVVLKNAAPTVDYTYWLRGL